MTAATLPPEILPEATGPVVQHLRNGDEVMRCAAARALAVLGGNDAASALVEALLDEDPDVRTDAMGALARCARPEDADAIRRSLLGDPVKEVKLAAIAALARLEDKASEPLLAALAKDRCDHDVAWEDEAGMWDDWLDIQVAAIEALGRMKAVEAVETLLAARADEMGQELNDVVFAALAGIPGTGIAALLALLREGTARVREQASSALAKAQPQALAPVLEILLKDASPEVRRLAVENLKRDESALETILHEDPAASVRQAALQKAGSGRWDLVLSALRDEDEEVRALALDLILSDPSAPLPDDLAANLQAWSASSGAVLAAASARALPRLSGAAALAPLCGIAEDTNQALEVRIAALRALSELPLPGVIPALEAAVKDPVRQIRAAGLASLASSTRAGEPALADPARALMAAAISGRLIAEIENEAEAHKPDGGEVSETLSASKVEDGGSRIRISREGDILSDARDGEGEDADSNVVALQFPTSTLAAIQTPAAFQSPEDPQQQLESPRAGDRPHPGQPPFSTRGQGKYRRRVAVDGPDDVVLDLQLVGLPIAASCPGEEIEAALSEAAASQNDSVRTAAFAAILRRSESQELSPALLSALVAGLADNNALIRGFAVQAAGGCGQVESERLMPLLKDADPVVRAAALKGLGDSLAEKRFDALKDSSALVRRTVLEGLMASGAKPELERGLRICLDCGWADSLSEFCKRSPKVRDLLLAELHHRTLGRTQALTVLEAVGSA